jgi:hypothetical protein
MNCTLAFTLGLLVAAVAGIALQARRDGSLDCIDGWARERGWRLTRASGGEGAL